MRVYVSCYDHVAYVQGFSVRQYVGAGQQGDQGEEDLWPGTWFEFTGAVATQHSHNHTKFIFIMLFSLAQQKMSLVDHLSIGVTPTHSSKGSSLDDNGESPSAARPPDRLVRFCPRVEFGLNAASCCVLGGTE